MAVDSSVVIAERVWGTGRSRTTVCLTAAEAQAAIVPDSWLVVNRGRAAPVVSIMGNAMSFEPTTELNLDDTTKELRDGALRPQEFQCSSPDSSQLASQSESSTSASSASDESVASSEMRPAAVPAPAPAPVPAPAATAITKPSGRAPLSPTLKARLGIRAPVGSGDELGETVPPELHVELPDPPRHGCLRLPAEGLLSSHVRRRVHWGHVMCREYKRMVGGGGGVPSSGSWALGIDSVVLVPTSGSHGATTATGVSSTGVSSTGSPRLALHDPLVGAIPEDEREEIRKAASASSRMHSPTLRPRSGSSSTIVDTSDSSTSVIEYRLFGIDGTRSPYLRPTSSLLRGQSAPAVETGEPPLLELGDCAASSGTAGTGSPIFSSEARAMRGRPTSDGQATAAATASFDSDDDDADDDGSRHHSPGNYSETDRTESHEHAAIKGTSSMVRLAVVTHGHAVGHTLGDEDGEHYPGVHVDAATGVRTSPLAADPPASPHRVADGAAVGGSSPSSHRGRPSKGGRKPSSKASSRSKKKKAPAKQSQAPKSPATSVDASIVPPLPPSPPSLRPGERLLGTVDEFERRRESELARREESLTEAERRVSTRETRQFSHKHGVRNPLFDRLEEPQRRQLLQAMAGSLAPPISALHATNEGELGVLVSLRASREQAGCNCSDSASEIQKMAVKRLRQELTARGLPNVGSRAQMADRLRDAIASEPLCGAAEGPSACPCAAEGIRCHFDMCRCRCEGCRNPSGCEDYVSSEVRAYVRSAIKRARQTARGSDSAAATAEAHSVDALAGSHASSSDPDLSDTHSD